MPPENASAPRTGGGKRADAGNVYGKRSTNAAHVVNKAGAWRFRRCPNCRQVSAAGEFSPVGTFRAGWQEHGSMRRACPRCGHTAPTKAFTVVRERRAS
jgi:predicted RNA-binding Zn-ribbon protein involved in translation (DUF1610 family)